MHNDIFYTWGRHLWKGLRMGAQSNQEFHTPSHNILQKRSPSLHLVLFNKITVILMLTGIPLVTIGILFFYEFGIISIPIGILLIILGAWFKPPNHCPNCFEKIENYTYKLDPNDPNIRINRRF